jgi:hypothetical protein
MFFPMAEPVAGIDLHATRGFDYGERRYEKGDRFPWRDVGCSYSAAWQMWKIGMLEVAGIELRARRAFDHTSGHFEQGDPFPWQKLGVTEQQASEFLSAGLVEVASWTPYVVSQQPNRPQKQKHPNDRKHDRPA